MNPSRDPKDRLHWGFAPARRGIDIALRFLAGCDGTEQVLFIGRAQEKTTLFRTHKRHRADGSAYPWISRDTGMVNHLPR